MPVDDDWLQKLGLLLGGGLFGAMLLESHYDDKRKSRVEKEDPEGCKELCNTVSEILDRWEPPDFEYEDDYTEDLFEFLDRRIRRRHRDRAAYKDNSRSAGHLDRTEENRTGSVDRPMLRLFRGMGDLGDRDRHDMPEDKVGRLRELLQRKDLHYIDIIEFSLPDDDED